MLIWIRYHQSLENNEKALGNHIRLINNEYTNVTLLSVLNKDDKIEKRYQDIIKKYNNKNQISFVNFEFHFKTRPLLYNYTKLNHLFDDVNIKSSFNNYGFNHIRLNGKFSFEEDRTIFENAKVQSGVIRTNCLEGLDRTNITQYMIARKISSIIFDYISNENNIYERDVFISFDCEIESMIRSLWTENGDQLARSYASGNTLFSDITKNHSRTFKGALSDLINSICRYVNNNFYDGYRQDCHDYFLGKISPKRNNLENHSNITIYLCFVYFILCLLFINNYAFPKFQDYIEINIFTKCLTYLVGMYILSKLLVNFHQYIVDVPTLKGFSNNF